VDRALGRLATFVVFIFVGAVLAGGYAVLRGRVVESVYQEKLDALVREYESLRVRYNDAVKQTAVTELVVEGESVDVVVRGVDGLIREIETDLDPDQEVHVDFVVKEGRLFIRRVYDDETAPASGIVIDPELVGVDWDDPDVARGLTVYRGELAPGRWVVSTTGNGALDLVSVPESTEVELRAAPPVRSYDAVEEEVDESLRRVSAPDVLRRGLDLLR